MWAGEGGGKKSSFHYSLKEQQKKNHSKMLTKQKGKQGWKTLFSHIQLVCYTFWSATAMKSKELKYAFKKHLKAFFVMPKQS